MIQQLPAPVSPRSRSPRPKVDLSVCSRLPTLPQVAIQILETFDSIDTPLEAIVKIIERDPAVASKIMLAANSARFAPQTRIAELRRAVLMLGKRAVTPLVLSFCLAPEAMKSGPLSRHYHDFWLTAVIRSAAAGVIAHTVAPVLTGDASTIALLSSIGRLALLRHHASLYSECLQVSESTGRPEGDVERDVIGFTHVELSAQIMTHLRFAERGIRAIRWQRESALAISRLASPAERPLCHIVAAACALSDYVLGNDHGVTYVQLGEHLQELNHDRAFDLEQLVVDVREHVEPMRSLLNIDSLSFPDPLVLLQKSLEQLAQFSLMLHADACEKEVPQQLLEENGKLKRRVADLIQQATVDPLTGVYNRGQLDALRQEYFSVAPLRQQPVGLLVVDVDLFKQVNDQFGHAAGDKVLKRVAEKLVESIRESDILGRYGGEEFLLLVSDAHMEAMQAIAERARAMIEAMTFVEGEKRFTVTVSIGGACGICDGTPDYAERLFLQADEALYRAKRSGRNRAIIVPLSLESSDRSTHD